MPFYLLLILGFAFGIGFGFFVQKAGFCIAVGMVEFYLGSGKRFLKMLMLVIAISTFGFWLSGIISDDLGLKTIGQIRGYGFYNLVSGMIFGSGIVLCGGCILGTLRQIGEGNLNYVITLLFFIPGMALVVYVLDPILEKGYFVKNILVHQLLGVNPAWTSIFLSILALILFLRFRVKK